MDAPVRTKSEAVVPPGHSSERQADAAADAAMRHIESPTSSAEGAAAPPTAKLSSVGTVMAKSEGGGFGATPSGFSTALERARGGGSELPARVRGPLEHAMGAEFSGVRVHADAAAHQLNHSIRAKAFTSGRDIYFRRGAYDPGSRGGQRLLAHELAHVVQQHGAVGKPSVVQRVIVDHMASGEDPTQRDRGHRSILRQRERLNAQAARLIGPSNPALTALLSKMLHGIEYDSSTLEESSATYSRIGTELGNVVSFLQNKLVQLRRQPTQDEGAIAATEGRLRDLAGRTDFLDELTAMRSSYMYSDRRYYSHADPNVQLTDDNGVITSVSTSSSRYFGNIHAIAYLEYVEGGRPRTIMAHIPGGATGGQVSPFEVRDVQGDQDTLAKLSRNRRKRSWVRSKTQIKNAKAKAEQVKQEAEQDQKYVYRRMGTGLEFKSVEGSFLPQRRQAINCARYVEKILKASGLSSNDVTSGSFFKTPQQVALGTTGGGDFKRWTKRMGRSLWRSLPFTDDG